MGATVTSTCYYLNWRSKGIFLKFSMVYVVLFHVSLVELVHSEHFSIEDLQEKYYAFSRIKLFSFYPVMKSHRVVPFLQNLPMQQ